jgi:hypothetical protein
LTASPLEPRLADETARAVLRISTGVVLDQVKVGRLGLDLIDSLIMLAVTQANVQAVMSDPALQRRYAAYDSPPPDSLRRPISILAVAQSLGLPYETVRRRVTRLRWVGAYRFTESGVYVPTGRVRRPAHQAALEAAHARVLGLHERLAALGAVTALAPCRASAWRGPPPLRATARISAEYMLRLVAAATEVLGDPVSALIWFEVLRSSTEHLPDDAADELSARPARAAEVAKRLGLAAETVRRRLVGLVADGACLDSRQGYVTPPDLLSTGPFVQLARRNAADLTRMFAALAQLGVLPSARDDVPAEGPFASRRAGR